MCIQYHIMVWAVALALMGHEFPAVPIGIW